MKFRRNRKTYEMVFFKIKMKDEHELHAFIKCKRHLLMKHAQHLLSFSFVRDEMDEISFRVLDSRLDDVKVFKSR